MGSKKNDRVHRNEFRRKLRSWGMPEEEIELCVQQMAERKRLKNIGKLPLDAPICTRAEYVRMLKKKGVSKSGTPVLRLGDDYEAPDDKDFKPSRVDSLLSGTARVTGMTAKVVKRKKTVTKYQYDKEN
jgi:hypothetical protein